MIGTFLSAFAHSFFKCGRADCPQLLKYEFSQAQGWLKRVDLSLRHSGKRVRNFRRLHRNLECTALKFRDRRKHGRVTIVHEGRTNADDVVGAWAFTVEGKK